MLTKAVRANTHTHTHTDNTVKELSHTAVLIKINCMNYRWPQVFKLMYALFNLYYCSFQKRVQPNLYVQNI
jgi:hypothetical protein